MRKIGRFRLIYSLFSPGDVKRESGLAGFIEVGPVVVISRIDAEPENSHGPYLALLGVQALFGSLPVIGKLVLAVMPAVALVGFRVGIAAIVLIIIQAYRRRFFLADRGDYLRLAILSLFGVTFNQLLFITGLSLTKAVNTSLLAVTIPIFTIGIGAMIGTERLTRRTLIGILLAAVGVIVIIDPRGASFASDTLLGDVLIIVNSLSYGIYVATSKSTLTRNGAFRSMMWIFIFAAVICVPMGIVSFASAGPPAVEPYVWLLVLHIGVLATAAPYLLNAWALARVKPSTVAIFVYLQPLIGFVLAVIYLRERVNMSFIAAAAMIFAGVYLVSRRRAASRTV